MSDYKENYDLVVVGGGITGLVVAYLASKTGKKVAVVENSKIFGGLLNTFEIGGNRLEYFYHHFFTHDAELNWLIKDLGLEDRLFYKKTTMGVFRNRKIFNFNSPVDLLKFSPISWLDKIKFGMTSVYMGKVAKWQDYENVSAMDWLNKWSGKTTAAALWMPLLKIKFGPFAAQVPLAWMVGRMRQRMGSRNKGDERLGYLNGSLQTLLDTLLHALESNNVDLLPHTEIVNIQIELNKVKSLQIAGGNVIKANQYLFSIPSQNLSKLLKAHVPEYAQKMDAIKYFGAICVVLELSKPLSDIYWLNIADEGFPFGGIIEHTNFIPKDEYNGSHIAYLSRYFAHNEAIATMTEDEVKTLMLDKISAIYPDFDITTLKKVYLFKTMTAATVCDLNFSEKVLDCETPIENMYIANMSHIYPDERSVNNSIRIASEACKVMKLATDEVPYNQSLSGKIGFNQ